MKRSLLFFFGKLTSSGTIHSDEGKKSSKSVSPSEYVIRNILNYSKSLSTCQTRFTGHIHLVMN
ncbi:MAG: hypothetical protein D4R67_06210 [Bacteroidetes bacterium]|nr:MAG: hypothetical protein D4R67_06210 [Bacteroidota bacterium]